MGSPKIVCTTTIPVSELAIPICEKMRTSG